MGQELHGQLETVQSTPTFFLINCHTSPEGSEGGGQQSECHRRPHLDGEHGGEVDSQVSSICWLAGCREDGFSSELLNE